ncbi:eCIS core domain-containing protein [Azohydromonas caseinilytica]|uniref:eCIS core domain-containing protein n=1 Tax=Azohydromonas caseinilytica TaxID=2728836 RepID=UPI00197BF8F8|nr:DUF4157 domain-containing protein [Azohydromonas caseinilytica]
MGPSGPEALVADVLSGPGEPLPAPARQAFESRLGADLSGVRLHRGAAAAASAQALAARAYTVGQHIVLGAGAWAPQSSAGRRLLAHELVHTLQQRHARAVQRLAVGRADDTHEAEAARLAQRALQDGAAVGLPTPSPLAVQCLQRITDAEFERSSGAGTGLADGTLSAVNGVHGSSFEARNCFGVEGCNIHFDFEKAYVGTYPYGAASGRTVRGAYVKIVMHPDASCWSCNRLEVVQVLRNVTRTAGGATVTADPENATRRERSGWGDASAPSRGWRVDRLTTATDPFYSHSWTSQSGDFRTPAILRDAPGDWDTDRNAGKDFQSCLLCVNGGSRVALGCVTWGYYIDGAGAVSFHPQPVASCGGTTQLRDATQRWDRIPGNQPVNLGSVSPARPAGETPRPIPPGGTAVA